MDVREPRHLERGVLREDPEPDAPAQARGISALANKPLFPPSWAEAIKWEQETADLLAEGGFVKKFDVGVLFDHRFEGIAAKAVSAEYRR